jgi:hypothetical protein
VNKNRNDEEPLHVPDLRVESERLRLGPAGFYAFFIIAVKWGLTDVEALDLLALGTQTPIEQLRNKPDPKHFTEERMFRISNLIGIYKGLQINHSEYLANRWVKLRNRNQLFGGATPLEFMVNGGVDAMHRVRKLIDARCAWN